MIEADHRLVLLAENHAGAAPWYQLAYQRLTQETPFTFPSARLLTRKADLPASCKPNRGPPSAPLFLINHWVSTDPVPKPSDAAKVNAYAPLLARAGSASACATTCPTCSRSTSTSGATSSAWSKRSTASERAMRT
jgi:hypothetical protein